MAKKKMHEETETAIVDVPVPENHESETAHESDSGRSTEPDHPLMEEIQTFLHLRDELARKLAIEIEATEQKLAELKKTAASLFPQSGGEVAEEKKAKKPKPKTPKEEKSSSAASHEKEPETAE